MRPWQDLTDMFNDEDIIVEMKKKYYNTYLGITTEDKKTFYGKYVGFTGGNHNFLDRYGVVTSVGMETYKKVFIPKLDKQLANNNAGRAFVVVRNPYRQNRRGISTDSHYIDALTSSAVEDGHKIAGLNNLDLVIFDILENKDKFPTLETAIGICDREDSCAISTNFAVMLNAINEDTLCYMICLFNLPIAILDTKSKTISCFVKEFSQEILDNKHLFPNYHMV